MKTFRLISLSIGFVVAALPALAAGRYAISPAAVAAAMNSAGVHATAEQVTLLSNVVASTAEPQLRVQSVHPWGDRRFIVRIECGTEKECLPFMVGLRLSQSDAATLAWVNEPVKATTPKRMVIPPVLVHAGSPATLLLDGDHIHIRLSVICLQNGASGQIVRATDNSRRIVYSAEVTDNGILKGRL